MKRVGCILLMSALAFAVWAQKESKDVKAGNKWYKSSKFSDAEVAYRKGLAKNSKSFEARYNLGNALYKQKKFDKAMEAYNEALTLKPTEKLKVAAALHNLGNSFLAQKKYEESINAFKSALKNNPKDEETRYNLAYAQTMLKQQQNKNNKDKNKDKQDQKQDQKQNQKQPQKQPQPQPQQPQPKPQMSKQNAQQLLDALMQDEKNTQDKAKKIPARGNKKAEKDW